MSTITLLDIMLWRWRTLRLDMWSLFMS